MTTMRKGVVSWTYYISQTPFCLFMWENILEKNPEIVLELLEAGSGTQGKWLTLDMVMPSIRAMSQRAVAMNNGSMMG